MHARALLNRLPLLIFFLDFQEELMAGKIYSFSDPSITGNFAAWRRRAVTRWAASKSVLVAVVVVVECGQI
jgi:hypothetical protein